MTLGAVNIVFDPLIPWLVLALISTSALILSLLGVWRRATGSVCRLTVFIILAGVLANPTLVQEQRETKPDIAVIAVDESASQMIGDRPETSAMARRHILTALDGMADLEVRTVTVRGARSGGADDALRQGTDLFRTLDRVIGEIPRDRLAGVIAITDGQVHDAKRAIARGNLPAPFHVILTGRRHETDRRLRIDHAPTFGMVGRDVKMTIRVDDPDSGDGEPVSIGFRVDGIESGTLTVPANRSHSFTVPLDHAGETIVELVAGPRSGELSLINNQAVQAISGVRDRLRVLLVSGAPHSGERTWRNILKSDPSVDLVHFTILRPPEKQDGTPVQELSLIPFPIKELFELNLPDFDLIVFDRYRRRGVLARNYLSNIVNYVKEGGAFLEASGPTFSGHLSLTRTPLGAILPATPTGAVTNGGYRPRVTDIGFRHPVTVDLPGGGRVDSVGKRVEAASWGRWLRLVDADQKRGVVLIDGPGERPVLILDRVGKGRVAHLLSDHIWLWSRGYEGGGPQAEMLRRTAHWLMKEPDLEEDQLQVSVDATRIRVRRWALDNDLPDITMTKPDGTTVVRVLSRQGPGRSSAQFETDQVGLHRFSDNDRIRLAAVGVLKPVEYDDLRTADSILMPAVEATGGGLHWAIEDGLPDLRRVRAGRATAGRNWIGLRANEDYVVTGVASAPLLPGLLALLLILGLAIIAWHREGT